jgi:hypothetical protein
MLVPHAMDKLAFVAVAVMAALVGCNRPGGLAAPQIRAESPARGPHHGEANAAAAARVGANGGRLFGEAIPAGASAVRLAEVLNAPQQYQNRPFRVEGTVVAVCQAMGCWMEVRDDATQAHIRMHGHSFFVPRDVNGRRAAVQATLVAAHPATECDHEAQAATGRVAQLELDATGIEVF